jgi:RHS repeat-associated protein
MKTRTTSLLGLLSLLSLALAPHLASAHYDPSLQRWINRDPLGSLGSQLGRGPRYAAHARLVEGEQGPNLYRFVGNDPATHSDTDGREIFPPPDVHLREPISCARDIEMNVWDKYGWRKDQAGGWVPTPDHHPGDDHFHFGHCVASCRITRECPGGRLTAAAAGYLKEIWDQIRHCWGDGPGAECGDLDANREGRARARKCPGKSCEEACRGTEG